MTEKAKVKITDTSLRDAHQSLMATRMKTEDMLPIADKMNRVGYHSLEVWGGATFDTCMRFLDEDPWERLKRLREVLDKTRLQMLLRGQNVVGYKHYPDDVVESFIEKALANGIDIIRIFDALNDVRNMQKAMEATKAHNGHVQATLSYTISPMHDMQYFVNLSKKLKEMGADSIALKDMAGLISPYDAYELVRKLKDEVGLPVQLHCHYTSGMASMAYLKAVEAGADVLDTASAPLSMGSSQPATDSMVASLQGTPYDTGLDLELLAEISQYFKSIRHNYEIPLEVALGVDTSVLSYQSPGGMISNLASQLKEQNALDKLEDVLQEVPRVREDLGYPPLVTPSSQIVGTQAVVNVLMGKRYGMVSTEVKNYLKGLYGLPPGEINPDIVKQVLKGEEGITQRPADLLEPQMESAREEIAPYMKKEEDVLSYIMFPHVALEYFKSREEKEGAAGKKNSGSSPHGKNKINYQWEYFQREVDWDWVMDNHRVLVYPV